MKHINDKHTHFVDIKHHIYHEKVFLMHYNGNICLFTAALTVFSLVYLPLVVSQKQECHDNSTEMHLEPVLQHCCEWLLRKRIINMKDFFFIIMFCYMY